jgi:IPT/TIG domain
MSSVLITVSQAANSAGTPAPLIGTKNDTYDGLQVLGAVIAVGIFTVIVLVRRYLAAREASLSIGRSISFAIRIWSNKAANAAVPVPRGLLTGTDNRVSTSKTAAALWTVVLIYFIASMALIFGSQLDKYKALIQSISPLYLVLLGGPFAAAVLAKSIVSGAADAGQVQKGQGTPSVADVFSDDDGNTDLIDTQYIAFNILIAIIVIIQFAGHPGYGAPAIPDFLAALTGTSAAAYVANKAVTTGNPPSITQVNPSQVRPEGQVTVYGQNFLVQGDNPKSVRVTVAGLPAQLDTDDPTPTQLTFRVPPNAVTGAVTVLTPSGLSTPAAVGGANNSPTLTVIPDSIQVTRIDNLSTMPGGTLTLFGSGFFNAADVDWQGSALAGHGADAHGQLTLQNLLPNQQPQAFDCPPATGGGVQSDAQLTLSVPPNVLPGSYGVTVHRGALSCDPSMVVRVS